MLRVADHFSDSDVGRQRQGNEDAYFVRSPLFVVADGMGGAQAGEVASDMAVRSFEGGVPGSAATEGLADVIRRANREIHDRSRSDRRQAGMGTTVTAAYLTDGDEVVVAHVGDSRCYLLRDGDLVRLTRDHSLVGELVARGKLTEEQAETHPQRSVITRALGPEPDVEVDVDVFPARAGDLFMLCSDGLTSMVSERVVKETLSGPGTLDQRGRALIAAANRAGGRDNITVVLFRVEDAGDGPATELAPAAGQGREETGATRDIEGVGDATGETASIDAVAPASGAAATARPPRSEPTGPQARASAPAAADDRLPPPGQQDRAGRRRAARRPRRRRPLKVLIALLVVAFLVLAPLWIASRAVYFVGVDTERNGVVTIYRGIPYELPGGVRLYERFYPSGVTIDSVPASRRETFTNHKLRSRDDVEDLVIALERGELNR